MPSNVPEWTATRRRAAYLRYTYKEILRRSADEPALERRLLTQQPDSLIQKIRGLLDDAF